MDSITTICSTQPAGINPLNSRQPVWAYRPGVAIHLPVFNEKYVIHRLIAACARMAEEYDIERVKIFISMTRMMNHQPCR